MHEAGNCLSKIKQGVDLKIERVPEVSITRHSSDIRNSYRPL